MTSTGLGHAEGAHLQEPGKASQRQRHLSHLEMEGEGGNAWQQDPQSQSMDARLPGASRKAADDSERLTGHLSERGKWEATGWSGGKSVVARPGRGRQGPKLERREAGRGPEAAFL